MWSGGTLPCVQLGFESHPLHMEVAFVFFFHAGTTLLQCCCNAVYIKMSMYGQYLINSVENNYGQTPIVLLNLQVKQHDGCPSIIQYSMFFNAAAMLFKWCYNAAVCSDHQMDGCLMDTMLHKHCYNGVTMLCILHTIAWDAVRCGYYQHRRNSTYI